MYCTNLSNLSNLATTESVIVTNLNSKILNPTQAFNVKLRSGIVELECIMELPPGTYKQGELLGTIKPAPLHTVRMNCVATKNETYVINIYAKTGFIQFNNSNIETTRDLFFIGQAAYIAES